PGLPMPVTTTWPGQASISSSAAAKLLPRRERSERIALASASSTERAYSKWLFASFGCSFPPRLRPMRAEGRFPCAPAGIRPATLVLEAVHTPRDFSFVFKGLPAWRRVDGDATRGADRGRRGMAWKVALTPPYRRSPALVLEGARKSRRGDHMKFFI